MCISGVGSASVFDHFFPQKACVFGISVLMWVLVVGISLLLSSFNNLAKHFLECATECSYVLFCFY